MGPAPSMSAYQSAASSIYEPQKQADITSAINTKNTTITNEEALKPQIQTDYQSAIDNLTKTTNSNIAKINQLYTQRLGGNFSGLQGNDLGGMFATASKNQATIESTRANKLSAIATTETNAINTLASDISSITSKYQSSEAQYAQSSYDAAVKQYNTDQLNAEKLQQGQERIDIEAAKASAGKAPSQADIKSQNMSTIGNSLVNKAGKDGHVSQDTWNAAMATWLEKGGSQSDFVKQYGQFINQRYKGYHGFS